MPWSCVLKNNCCLIPLVCPFYIGVYISFSWIVIICICWMILNCLFNAYRHTVKHLFFKCLGPGLWKIIVVWFHWCVPLRWRINLIFSNRHNMCFLNSFFYEYRHTRNKSFWNALVLVFGRIMLHDSMCVSLYFGVYISFHESSSYVFYVISFSFG